VLDRRIKSPDTNRENLSDFAQSTGLAVAVMVVFLVVWQLAVVISNIHPIVLPSPLRVLQVAWQERVALMVGYMVTGLCALIALLISITLGSTIAVVFAQSAKIRAAFQPYVVFLQTVPIVAIAPLLITWFGYGLPTVILVATIISLFPIISNVTAGLTSVDRNLVELFQLNGAGRIKTLLKLRIPFAVSHLVLGTRISSGMTVIGAIIGELFVGTSAEYAGLGKLMMGWQILARTDALIAVVITSTLLGISMLGLVNLICRMFLRRWIDSSGFEMQR
jgi:NitT/TauT family transport system permease protein